jgi:hypothetical protein
MDHKPALARIGKLGVEKEGVSSSKLSPAEKPCFGNDFASSPSRSSESSRSHHWQRARTTSLNRIGFSTVRKHLSEAEKHASVLDWQSLAAVCASEQEVFDESPDWDWDEWLTPEGKIAFGLI